MKSSAPECGLEFKVSSLRYSLGQSRADFARTMSVDLQTVFAWEAGSLEPSPSQASALIRLHQQSEAYAERTVLRPMLEEKLREGRLSQIHSEEIVCKIDFHLKSEIL